MDSTMTAPPDPVGMAQQIQALIANVQELMKQNEDLRRHAHPKDLIMVSFSSLIVILNQNKLTGPNYVDWKRNLDIVLIVEEHKFVLSEPCLDIPTLDAPSEERQRYDRWWKSNKMSTCYVLASISNVLQHQMEDMELASDIMFSLKEMFGEQGHSTRQDTIRLLLNTKMAQGTPVREHCLKMISYLNTLEVLGADIDGESQVNMIL
ncbi:uncharacterized protein LOC142608972 [Castanea sativa]|uniref:uncharacterized protein LOC142608972 n=1 Tax=Castanea sativa TaxID=21020 RepID=UPI003F650B0D